MNAEKTKENESSEKKNLESFLKLEYSQAPLNVTIGSSLYEVGLRLSAGENLCFWLNCSYVSPNGGLL